MRGDDVHTVLVLDSDLRVDGALDREGVGGVCRMRVKEQCPRGRQGVLGDERGAGGDELREVDLWAVAGKLCPEAAEAAAGRAEDLRLVGVQVLDGIEDILGVVVQDLLERNDVGLRAQAADDALHPLGPVLLGPVEDVGPNVGRELHRVEGHERDRLLHPLDARGEHQAKGQGSQHARHRCGRFFLPVFVPSWGWGVDQD
mmetsp:Transcript_2633/g.6502  ORF Transcript_2633/g.6502 Transcript_2633/m.6502 type:complete len:201 (+) Transcript_2633:743-1345(+)